MGENFLAADVGGKLWPKHCGSDRRKQEDRAR